MMKKKFLLLLAAVLLGVSFVFVSVGCADVHVENIDKNFLQVSQSYQKVSSSKKIVKSVQVCRDDLVLNSVVESYVSVEEGYSLTIKTVTLNPIGEGSGMYEETTSDPRPVSRDEISFGSLLEYTCYSELDYSEADQSLIMNAKIKKEFFGRLNITDDKIQGDIAVRISVEDGKFVSMSYEYLSSNGNDVAISFQYGY